MTLPWKSDPVRRFWAKVDKVDGACWEWVGVKTKSGYGRALMDAE